MMRYLSLSENENEAKSLGSLFASEEEDEPGHEYSQWNCLPDLLLEQIFQYLTIRERFYASQVCRSWNEAFYFPRVWYTFNMYDGLLTKRKFNYYAGWEISFLVSLSPEIRGTCLWDWRTDSDDVETCYGNVDVSQDFGTHRPPSRGR
ncbi:F-box/LRR-repeat protein 21 [Armadillidium nasatum]|uniref:F-box/LRR-repeat protein 21 n=1 Tax=Armadillidium nasatum TaxID=96803 RepID=A0A5N5TNJ5_9CRUS|nr:F-box/LRR-repeat protein 21 [Armadillidium nasatum]